MKFIFTLFFIAVFAQDPTFDCGTGLTCTYVQNEFKLKIEGSGVMKNFTSSAIPWSSHKDTITNVEISSGVTHLGDYAFYKITNLQSITIPDTVVYIGKSTFRECSKLKQITFGSSPALKEIGQYAFQSMGTHYYTSEYQGPNVTIEVTLPSSLEIVGDSVFESANTNKITFNGVKTIGKRVFADSSYIYVVNIANTIESIDDNTFTSCYELKEINILNGGNSKYTSGNGVLIKKDGQENILIKFPPKCTATNIPDGVTIISEKGMASLEITSIGLPSSLKEIKNNAFEFTKLTSITFNEGLKTVGKQAFSGCTGLKTITISKTIETIGEEAFLNCHAIEKFIGNETEGTFTVKDNILYTQNNTILVKCPPKKTFTDGKYENPDSVQIIYASAFLNAENLKTLVLKGKIETIHDNVFKDCNALKTVTLQPTYLDSIGEYVFSGCTELTTVTFSDGVKMIGDSMFEKCKNLTTINLGNRIFTIESNAFKETAIKKITIPDTCVYIKYSAFQDCKQLEEVTIGNSSIEISDDAFYGCEKLKTLTFNEGSKLVRINEGAFEGVIIEKVTIPSSVLIIDDDAFGECKKLKEVVYHGDQQPAYCSATAFDESPITKIELKQGYPQQEFCGIRDGLTFVNPSPSGGNNGTNGTTPDVPSGGNNGTNGTTPDVPSGGNNGTNGTVTPPGGNNGTNSTNGTTPSGGNTNKDNGASYITIMMIVLTVFFLF